MGKVLDNLSLSFALFSFASQIFLRIGNKLSVHSLPFTLIIQTVVGIGTLLIPIGLILGIIALCNNPERKWKPILAIALTAIPVLSFFLLLPFFLASLT